MLSAHPFSIVFWLISLILTEILIYSCLVFQLDIVQQEYIQQEGLNQTDLVKVAFSAQGKWLATVEEREEEPDLELHLKLWFFDEETQR